MESRAKALGHPIHPILIVFPLGLLATSVLVDLFYLLTNTAGLPYVSFVMIGIDVLTGLLAAIFGVWDWLAIPSNTRAKSVGAAHGVGNVAVLALFIFSWLVRRGSIDYEPTGLAYALSLVGVGIALLTGWLGGELIYRLGVGVDRGAHLDAPNSLSGEPARASEATNADVRSTAR